MLPTVYSTIPIKVKVIRSSQRIKLCSLAWHWNEILVAIVPRRATVNVVEEARRTNPLHRSAELSGTNRIETNNRETGLKPASSRRLYWPGKRVDPTFGL